jgi:hypothetical protein
MIGICFCISVSLTVVFSDFVIKGGKIVNSNNGPIEFDLTNDNTANITMSPNGMLGIGVLNPQSSVDLSGSIGMSSELFTANGTVSDNTIVLGDTSSGNITLTLPTPSTVTGRIYQIKKISADNDLIVTSSTNIDNSSTVTLNTTTHGYPFLNVYSSGAQWYITSRSD